MGDDCRCSCSFDLGCLTTATPAEEDAQVIYKWIAIVPSGLLLKFCVDHARRLAVMVSQRPQQDGLICIR